MSKMKNQWIAPEVIALVREDGKGEYILTVCKNISEESSSSTTNDKCFNVCAQCDMLNGS